MKIDICINFTDIKGYNEKIEEGWQAVDQINSQDFPDKFKHRRIIRQAKTNGLRSPLNLVETKELSCNLVR